MHFSGRTRHRTGSRRLGRAVLLLVVAGAASAAVLAFTPAGTLTAHVPPTHYGAGDPQLPWLHAAQSRIVDAHGRAVILRGFNVSALVSYPKHAPAPFDETDATLIQRAGFDVVRLGIDWAQLEPVRGQIDQSYLDRVADAVQMLNRHALYVVLDMHFRLGWSPSFGYSGAPGWASLPGIPNWNPLPQVSWIPAFSPAAFAADTYFWLLPDWKADFYRVWQAVARRFRENSGVAGYDFFNEPHPLPIPPRLFEKYWMWPLYRSAIEAVGAVDSNHMFFMEGILLLSLDTVVVHLHAPNLVYATHVYEGSLVPPFWNGDPRPLADRFRQRQREAGELRAPLWIGEFGHDLTQREGLPYADAALDDADDLGLGWAWWQWRENRYWGIRDAAGSSLNLEALRHLARPYLIAAPDGVRQERSDGLHGQLDITVGGSHDSAPLLVGWSALTLAAPQVAGDCVRRSTWDAAAGRLTIDLLPASACMVRVRSG